MLFVSASAERYGASGESMSCICDSARCLCDVRIRECKGNTGSSGLEVLCIIVSEKCQIHKGIKITNESSFFAFPASQAKINSALYASSRSTYFLPPSLISPTEINNNSNS
jgi:hypothetical protein